MGVLKKGEGKGKGREREKGGTLECEMGEGEFETLLGIPGAFGPGIREARENRTLRPDRFGCKYKC